MCFSATQRNHGKTFLYQQSYISCHISAVISQLSYLRLRDKQPTGYPPRKRLQWRLYGISSFLSSNISFTIAIYSFFPNYLIVTKLSEFKPSRVTKKNNIFFHIFDQIHFSRVFWTQPKGSQLYNIYITRFYDQEIKGPGSAILDSRSQVCTKQSSMEWNISSLLWMNVVLKTS